MLKTTTIVLATCFAGITITGCHTSADNNGNSATANNNTTKDTGMVSRKVSMVISAIPFPSGILDTLHNVHSVYQTDLPNPTNSMNLYSESNTQSINLGIYGADLAYVISFEQFQEVGKYMKATKFLADNIGIPLAFTQDVIERCQKNQNNKDSLNHIVFSSYGIIDNTLKTSQREASEVLVLAGGWLEGMYLTTHGLASVTAEADRQVVYGVLIEQKQYLDKLLTMIDIITNSPYCQSVSTSLHDIRGAFNAITDTKSVSTEALKTLTDKVNELRARVVKGGNA